MINFNLKMQKPGFRNIKTAIAVVLCMLLYQFLDRQEGLILAAIAALICIQESIEKSVEVGQNRMIGTILGGIAGALFIYFPFFKSNFYLYLILVFLGIIVLIYIFNLMQIKDSIIIGCIVFLTIAFEVGGQISSPFIYSIIRVIDTFIGIIVGTSVNYFLFRPKAERIAGNDVITLDYEIVSDGQKRLYYGACGDTEELFIYPEDTFYGDRDFLWRVSTTRLTTHSSIFTSLPGYNRLLMVLDGRAIIHHRDHHQIHLNRFEQDFFDGGWQTKVYGFCVDLNLMIKEGYKGAFYTIQSESTKILNPHVFTAFYILAESTQITATAGEKIVFNRSLKKNDFILFYPTEEKIDKEINITLFSDSSENESVIAIEILVDSKL